MTMKLGPLKKLQRKSPSAFKKAAKVGTIQFLTWANTGSKLEKRTPPIRWGVLRGSSSAFVGSELVTTFQQSIKSGAPERPTPATSHAALSALIMTWVWNTDYARRMHEWGKKATEKWGKFTLQAGNAGNKWLEKHLQRDRNALMKVIGMEFKKETGI